jgi:hypothetical protein
MCHQHLAGVDLCSSEIHSIILVFLYLTHRDENQNTMKNSYNYHKQVELIRTSDKYFSAMLALYQKLHTEILFIQTFNSSLGVGFLAIFFTGVYYSLNNINPLFLIVVLPPLGCLTIIVLFGMVGIAKLAFKKAEIEICFQRANMPLFNWETKYGFRSGSTIWTYIGVGFVLIAPFLMGSFYTFLKRSEIKKYEHVNGFYIMDSHSISFILIIVNAVISLLVIIAILILIKHVKRYQSELRSIDQSCARTEDNE